MIRWKLERSKQKAFILKENKAEAGKEEDAPRPMTACGAIFFDDRNNLDLASLKLAYLRLFCAGEDEAIIDEQHEWLVEEFNQQHLGSIWTITMPQWHRVARMQNAAIRILHRKMQAQQHLQLQIEVGMIAASDIRDLRQILKLQRFLDCIDRGPTRRRPKYVDMEEPKKEYLQEADATHKADSDMRDVAHQIRRENIAPRYEGNNALTRELLLLLFATPRHHDNFTTAVSKDKQQSLATFGIRIKCNDEPYQVHTSESTESGRQFASRARRNKNKHLIRSTQGAAPPRKAHNKAIRRPKARMRARFALGFIRREKRGRAIVAQRGITKPAKDEVPKNWLAGGCVFD